MTKKGERYGDSILRTKLHRPKVTGDIVRRQRLHEQMDLGLETPLTVVSAPAGYGKSMLVNHWAESLDHPCAWVSLDRTDSELEPFVAYFLAAVESLFPESCRETATLLHAANLPPVPVVARSLANELDVLDTPFVLVLDDYHRIAPSSTVHELFTQLLEYPPHPLRLVLTTRHDPPLGLSALRAGNRLRELRLQDLRFTESETAELLAMTAKTVSEDALANLQNEVEGWAVGLHLVSLALRHVENADSFINDLHGGLPHTQEYLLREVLAWQPPEVRDCILRSSILERFCPEVLDAVCFPDATSAPPGLSGRELVELLQRNNLFIISLDARSEWFRFHHLFQNLLRRQLQQSTGATEIATLHSRAGTWFESQGLITESIEHALAARDVARAADIVERHRSGEINLGRLDVVARWLAMLPVATRKERLKLLLTEAWILYPQVTTERLAPLIERVDALVQEGQPDDRELAAEVAFFKGYLQYWDGQGERSLGYLEQASRSLEGTQLLIQRFVHTHLALARSLAGQEEQAIRGLEDRIAEVDGSAVQYRAALWIALAVVHLLGGELARARSAAQRLLSLATESGAANLKIWADYLLACSYRHSGELDGAVRHFAFASSQLRWLWPRRAVDALAGLALAHQLNGRSEEAAEVVSRLRDFATETGDASCQSVTDSCRARIALLRGDRARAVDWARTLPRDAKMYELWMWLEVPWITQARVLIAAGSNANLQEATEQLATLRQRCETWHLTCQTIEVAVLQSLALERQGRADEALNFLKEAVAMAEPGGWVRPFVEAGSVMKGMLERLDFEGEHEEIVRQVLAAFEYGGAAASAETSPTPRAEPSRTTGMLELDALSPREIDVLELLADRFQNKEIAERLFLSVHTVNDHLKHIYEKLQVTGRREAVDRAVTLKILNPR